MIRSFAFFNVSYYAYNSPFILASVFSKYSIIYEICVELVAVRRSVSIFSLNSRVSDRILFAKRAEMCAAAPILTYRHEFGISPSSFATCSKFILNVVIPDSSENTKGLSVLSVS